MSLIDEIKLGLRVSTDVFDSEIAMLVAAAKADIIRVGIDPDLVEDEDDMDALVKAAIYCYCKANFGMDVQDAERFSASYRMIVADLMNSSANIAAADGESEE